MFIDIKFSPRDTIIKHEGISCIYFILQKGKDRLRKHEETVLSVQQLMGHTYKPVLPFASKSRKEKLSTIQRQVNKEGNLVPTVNPSLSRDLVPLNLYKTENAENPQFIGGEGVLNLSDFELMDAFLNYASHYPAEPTLEESIRAVYLYSSLGSWMVEENIIKHTPVENQNDEVYLAAVEEHTGHKETTLHYLLQEIDYMVRKWSQRRNSTMQLAQSMNNTHKVEE